VARCSAARAAAQPAGCRSSRAVAALSSLAQTAAAGLLQTLRTAACSAAPNRPSLLQGVDDFLKPVVQLVMFVTYGVYTLVGMGCAIMGGMYLADDDAQEFMTYGMLSIGLVMLLVGGAGGFATYKKIWLIMAFVELCNIALFLLMLCIMMIGFILGSGTTDPNKTFWQKSYGLETGEAYGETTIKNQVKFRQAQYGQGICDKLDAAKTACAAFEKTSTGSQAKKLVFGNCSSAKGATQLGDCKKCAKGCMDATITKAQDNMNSITVFTFITFAFIGVCIVWNNILLGGHIGEGDWDGIKAYVGMGLNGIVLLLSLFLIGFGIYSMIEANDTTVCPDSDCVGSEVIGVIVVGCFLMIVSGIAVGSIWKNFKVGVRLATFVLMALALILLIIGIFLGIVSGAMDDVNEKYDANFDSMKTAANKAALDAGEPKGNVPCPDTNTDKLAVANGCCSQLPAARKAGAPCKSVSEDTELCKGADKKAYDVAVTADTKFCKTKMSEKIKGDMTTFGIVAMIVVMGFVVVIYLTLRAIKYWRAGDDADE